LNDRYKSFNLLYFLLYNSRLGGVFMVSTINYYYKKRAKLIDRLGGHCYRCGCVDDLEFHHVNNSHKSHGIGGWQMLYRVEKELNSGVPVILLCHRCHQEVHNGEYKGDD